MDCYLVYIQMNNIYSSFSLKTNIASALSGDADMRLQAHCQIPTRFMPHTVYTKESCIFTVFDNTLCSTQLGMNSYAKSVMTGFFIVMEQLDEEFWGTLSLYLKPIDVII